MRFRASKPLRADCKRYECELWPAETKRAVERGVFEVRLKEALVEERRKKIVGKAFVLGAGFALIQGEGEQVIWGVGGPYSIMSEVPCDK